MLLLMGSRNTLAARSSGRGRADVTRIADAAERQKSEADADVPQDVEVGLPSEPRRGEAVFRPRPRRSGRRGKRRRRWPEWNRTAMDHGRTMINEKARQRAFAPREPSQSLVILHPTLGASKTRPGCAPDRRRQSRAEHSFHNLGARGGASLCREAALQGGVDAGFNRGRRFAHHFGHFRDDEELRPIEHPLLAERQALGLREEREALQHIRDLEDRAAPHLVEDRSPRSARFPVLMIRRSCRLQADRTSARPHRR